MSPGWPSMTMITFAGPTMPRCSSVRVRSRQATKLAGAITLRTVPPRLVSHTVDDPIGLMVRQRLQHHRPHHAEDRRRRADAQSQRHQCRGGEARRPTQHARAVAQITHRTVEHRRPDLVPRALPDPLHPAKLAQRLAPGLVWTHAGAPILRGLLIDVKTHLFVETALERAAPSERADPLPALCCPSHGTAQRFTVASSTRLTARDTRRHCASSSVNCRRPSRVSA